jgi:hypothetical protein
MDVVKDLSDRIEAMEKKQVYLETCLNALYMLY